MTSLNHLFFRPFFSACAEASKLPLSRLVSILHNEVKVKQIGNEQLYLVVSRSRVHGFVNISDIAVHTFCPRKFWYSYSLVKELNKPIILADAITLRRILVGIYSHKAFENYINIIKPRFLIETNIELIPEYEVIDEELSVIGHADLVKIDHNNRTVEVYELKTSWYRAPHEAYVYQLYAYCYEVSKALKYYTLTCGYLVQPNTMFRFNYIKSVEKVVKKLLIELRKVIQLDEPPILTDFDRRKCRKCGFRAICLADREKQKEFLREVARKYSMQ